MSIFAFITANTLLDEETQEEYEIMISYAIALFFIFDIWMIGVLTS